MIVRQLPAATAELQHALSWYHERSPRAAENLWLRVMDARRSIALFPLAAPAITSQFRRFILSGYPYDVIYRVLDNEILIVAFAHHSRRPGYSKARKDKP
jgi:plasmid stabilization system protein ParE